ncbi:hypothetical protein XELAEV_18036240mg [Xenopus laevis]|uniref:Uncharacterized protein n=1 Tax=Xenopus laevis TaxID=8355 RepID=A0A974CIF8_XENLA|nr:hypothetical protein XELAEV_18036240mg [Xenopus laevis]
MQKLRAKRSLGYPGFYQGAIKSYWYHFVLLVLCYSSSPSLFPSTPTALQAPKCHPTCAPKHSPDLILCLVKSLL